MNHIFDHILYGLSLIREITKDLNLFHSVNLKTFFNYIMKKIMYLNRFIPYNWMYHKRWLAALDRKKASFKEDENLALKKKHRRGKYPNEKIFSQHTLYDKKTKKAS